MAEDELISFITKSRQRGKPDDQIMRALVAVGWRKERILAAFEKLNSDLKHPQQAADEKAAETQRAEYAAAQKAESEKPAPEQKPAPEKPALQQKPAPPSSSYETQPPAQEKKGWLSIPSLFSKKSPQPQNQAQQLPKAQQQSPAPPQQQQTTAPAQPSPPTQQPIPPIVLQNKPAPLPSAPQTQPEKQPTTQKASPIPSQQAPTKMFPPKIPATPSETARISPPQEAQPPKNSPPSFSNKQEEQVKAASPPILTPLWPSEKAGVQPELPTPEYPRVQDEGEVKNPAFSNLEQATGGQGITRFLPFVAIIAILLLGAAAYIYFIAPSMQQAAAPQAGNTQLPPKTAVKNATQPQANDTGQESIISEKPLQQQTVDCGTDKDCFYSSALGCAKAKAEITQAIIFGVEITSTTYAETKGIENGKCTLYRKILKNDVKYPDALKQQLAASGQTPLQIALAEAEGKAQAAALVDRYSTCSYPVSEFDTMITGWSKGTFTFSSNDWQKYGCTGTLNDPISTTPSQNPPQSGNTTAQSAPSQPASAPAQQSTQPPEQTTPSSPGQNTTPANFTRTKQYFTSRGELPSKFCEQAGGTLVKIHYSDNYGSECVNPKNKEGVSSQTEMVSKKCGFVPCCYNGPLFEYSYSYDYFECGFY